MHCSNPYIVRQHALIFVAFSGIGVLFCVVAWLLGEPTLLLWRLVLTLFGTLALSIGVWGWLNWRIAIVVDRQGVWCTGYTWRVTLIPWKDILRATKLSFTSREGDHDAVVLELRNAAAFPGNEQSL